MKENDWIVANINNPDFTSRDFKDVIGMNQDNTQLLPYSFYATNSYVMSNPMFLNDSGLFEESKFRDFYTKSIDKFLTFNQNTSVIDNFEYSFFDTSQRPNSRVKKPGFAFTVVSNPDRISTGIAGRNEVGERLWSSSELGQTQKIYDSATGQFLDYSPNDISFTSNPIGWIKSLFDDPLIKATWDEEGDHVNPITHRTEHHYKGDLKLNSDGQYYYETLNGRSLVGKEVLSAFDILTVDGEGLNKYDFIDSDGLDKSVTGTIAKTALTVAPLFMAPWVSELYSGALIAREMAKAMPMLYGMVSSLWGNTEDSQTLNMIAAVGEKFTSGTSEYSRQNTFTTENIANLIGDVATQWGQQKFIAKSISDLRGGDKAMLDAYRKAATLYTTESANISKNVQQEALRALQAGEYKTFQEALTAMERKLTSYVGDPAKWQESALGKASLLKFLPEAEKLMKSQNRLGADASLAYMAIISNTDVYSSMLEHGASKRDAAAIAFGSTLGMFGVDRYLGLGEMFFDELQNGRQLSMRAVFRRESEALAADLAQQGIANPVAKRSLKDLVKRGMDFSKKIVGKYADDVKMHTTGFFGKALGEGLEEVSEELVTDFAKQIYEIAGEFSPNFINTSGITDVGAWDNAGERYLMSFLGGSLGGGMFYGVDVYQNGRFRRDTTKDELIYLVANNKTNDLLKELQNWRDKGKLGSTTLSATKYERNSDGKPVYVTAENAEDSQNEYIYKRLRESILQLENILNEDRTNLSEDDLFKLMVLSERRFLQLKDLLQDRSYVTGYLEEFRNITKLLVDAELALTIATRTDDGTPNGNILPDAASSEVVNNPQRLENIENLKKQVEELKKRRDSFLSGEQSLPYTEKMLFAVDSYLSGAFTSTTYEAWLKNNKHKTVDQLSEAEAEQYREEYLNYKKSAQKQDLDKAFELYKQLKEKVNPHIQALAQGADQFATAHEALLNLFGEESPLNNFSQIDFDTQLEGESEEDFANRRTQLEGESDEDFATRLSERQKKVTEFNKQKLQELYDGIMSVIDLAGGFIDPTTMRFLLNSFNTRGNDVALDIIDSYIRSNQSATNTGILNQVIEVLKKLKPDLSNIAEIREEVNDVILTPYMKEAQVWNEQITPIHAGLVEMFNDFGFNFDEGQVTGETFTNFIMDLASKIQAGDPNVEEVFRKRGREEVLQAIRESDDIVDSLLTLDFSDDSFLGTYFDEESNNPMEEYELAPVLDSIMNSPDTSSVILTPYENEEAMKNETMNRAAQTMDSAQNLISTIQEAVNGDMFVQLFNQLKEKVRDINPITQLLNNIALEIDPQNRTIEQLLKHLADKVSGIDSKSNFYLSEEEENSIRLAELILKSIKAYLYAASTNSNYNHPFGHNKVLNEFATKHKNVFPKFEELPTLDESIANMYMLEIDKYLQELSEDSPTSWIRLSNNNKINKRQKLLNAEKNFTKAKLEFLDLIESSGAAKFIIAGKQYNLLDGIESIMDENPAVRLHKIEDLFYKNLHRILDSGISIKDILKESRMLETLLNLDKAVTQTTSELDDTINYGKLTDFDKLVYFLTISGISSNEFNNFIKERTQQENNIVPLTIQEHTSRIALALIKSRQLFSDILNYVKEVTGDNRALLDYITFIDGSAGVGKTQVIARNAAKYVDSDDIWLVTPKETQLKTLKETIGKGVGKIRKEIFDLILDPTVYARLLDAINKGESDNELYNSIVLPGGNRVQILNKDAFTFNSTILAPKLIIIDEATHFSGLELQILNEYAKRNGLSIIALGDTNQNGFSKLSYNINKELTFAVRSPKLSISLRDVNLLKLENLSSVVHILNEMQRLDENDPLYDLKFNNLVKLIGQLNFKVYNLDELNGDLITGTLTTEQAAKLFGTVGFVGDALSPTYQKLKENTNLTVSVPLSEEEIQGQEFDFIVVDKEWNMGDSQYKKFKFLTDLYTMISRGKVGSILIDNGLSAIIGTNTTSLSKETAPNLKDAIEPFRQAKLEQLDNLGLVPNEEFEPTENPVPLEETPEETSEEEEEAVEGEDESLAVEEPIETVEDVSGELGDKTDEIADTFVSNLESMSDFPIRIYGAGHLSGFNIEEREVDGKRIEVWKNPHFPVKTDLQIFSSAEEVSSPEEKDALVTSLLALKSVLLYQDSLDNLPSSVTSVVDAEHLSKIKYKIEVRPLLDSDNFVGFTGLDRAKLAIDGLVYTLIGEFENNAGESCKVTLGLLANPESYRVPEGKSAEETRAIQSKIDLYKKLFKEITKQYQKDGKFNLEVTPSFSGLTHIRRKGNDGKPVQVRTLGTYRKAHRYSRVSKPYIYVGKNFKGIQSGVRGKAVVFVSNDTTLSEDELMQIYIEQKESTNAQPDANLFNLDVKPRVRMLVLDSAGIPFRTLAFTKRFKDLYSTVQTIGGKKSIKMFPFEEDYMGARMFVSLWNYRANLQNFLDEYAKFKERTGYSDADITRITTYSDALYKQAHSTASELPDNVAQILSTMTATPEEMKAVEEFNDSLATKVRQFRLGGSRKASGVYLRYLTNISSDNSFYRGAKGTPTGIYITPEVAQRQFSLIDSLLNTTFGQLISLKKADGTEWPSSRLISPKNGYNNSLSNLVTDVFANGELTIVEDGTEYSLKLPPHKSFKFVPIILLKVYLQLKSYQGNPEDFVYENIRISKNSGTPMDVSFLELKGLVRVDREDTFDSAFDDMLALAFHGTTADPTKGGMRATDAYFKQGLLVDPIGAEVEGETSTGSALFKKCLTNEDLFTVNAEIDMPIFTVSLREAEEAVDEAEEVEELEIVSKDIIQRIANDPEYLGLGLSEEFLNEAAKNATSLEEFYLVISESMNKEARSEAGNEVSNQASINNILDRTWSFDLAAGTRMSVKTYLEQKSGKFLDGATFSWENGNIIVSLSDLVTILKVGFDEFANDFTISEIKTTPIPTEGELSKEQIEAQKLSLALNYIKDWLERISLDLDLADALMDYEDIIEDFRSTYSSYGSIKDLINAVTNIYDNTDYDDSVLELLLKINAVNEGIICS